jgi:ElaB/YqjD/DUF883 family membrane-anchored ribosome-binding protein
MALITKRAAAKAEKKATKAAADAGSSVTEAKDQATAALSSLGSTTEKKAEKAVEELQKFASTVGPRLSEGASSTRDKATELYDQYRPQVEENLRQQGEKLGTIADKIGPTADKLRHDIKDDYLPRAKKTAEATNTVVSAAVGAAVEAARKELDKGQTDIVKAAATPTKKKGKGGKVLLFLGLAAAGAAAGYIAWQKTRPVEDPWAPPADFARAHYPASAGTDSDSSTVSDTVGSADAGDVASALKGEDRSSDVEPKEVKVDSDPEASSADEEKRGSHRGDA